MSDKPTKDEWRDAIAAAVMDARAASFAAPPALGYEGALPNASVESRGPGRPSLGAALAVPLDGGEAFMEGSYQRPMPQAPTLWEARAGYRRKF